MPSVRSMGGPRRRPLGASVPPLFGHLCLYSRSSTAVIVSLYVSNRRAIVSARSSLNRMSIPMHRQLLPWGRREVSAYGVRTQTLLHLREARSAKNQEVAGHFTLRVVSGTFAGPCVDLFAENSGMFSSVALGAHEGRLKDVRVAFTRDLEPRADYHASVTSCHPPRRGFGEPRQSLANPGRALQPRHPAHPCSDWRLGLGALKSVFAASYISTSS